MSILLKRAIATLVANPSCKFVIVLPDGTKYTQGNLKIVEHSQRNLTHPFGTKSKYYKPYLENLQAGELIEIPFNQFDPASLRSGITAHCCENWGKESVTTAINREKNCIEILRLK